MASLDSFLSRLFSRPTSLKFYLIKLILLAVGPVSVFSVIMIILFARHEQAALRRGLQETARALAGAIDKEFESAITKLEALATSEPLDFGAVREFQRVAARILRSQDDWKGIMLFDLSGRQLFNIGNPLAGVSGTIDRGSLNEILRTKRPVIANFSGPPSVEGSVKVHVPVAREDKVIYILSAALEPKVFMNILARQKLSRDWVGTVFDNKKITVARTLSPEQSVGKPVGAVLEKADAQVAEAFLKGVTREGVPSYATVSRSLASGWAVALTVPSSEVNTALRRSLGLVAGAGAVFFLTGIWLASIFARRVSGPISNLSSAANALGQGQVVFPPSTSPVVELNAVAQDMERAAELLRQRSNERDRIEAELRERDEFLQQQAQLLDLTNEAIFTWDTNSKIVYWNRGAETLYGFSRDEAVGREIHELLSTTFPGTLREIESSLGDTGEWRGELRHTTRNGKQLIVESHWEAITSLAGRRLVLECSRDITNRKRAIQRLSTEHAVTIILAESDTLEKATGRILQAIGEGLEWDLGTFWIVNKNVRQIECLETWHVPSEAFSGCEASPPLARGVGLPGRVWVRAEPMWISDVVNEAEFLGVSPAVKENLHGAFAVPIKLRHEVLGVIEFLSAEIREPDEDLLTMMAAIGSEMGQFVERLRGEAALRQSEENLRRQAQELEQQLLASGRLVAVGELTASMAHEFNNPLGIILGFAQGLLAHMDPSDPNYHRVEIIAEEAQRCGKIVQELLEFGRPKSADFILTDVKEVIEKTLDLASSRAAKSNVETTKQIAPDLPQIHADAQQLQQVLLNLCLNAMDAMPRGGRLTVGAAADSADQMIITVRDTGHGIDSDTLPRIFQPFFTAKKRRGLGLGLPICDRILKAHGGTIEVESDPGQGTTFRIHLPIDGAASRRTTEDLSVTGQVQSS